jgi:hypothetical protein
MESHVSLLPWCMPLPSRELRWRHLSAQSGHSPPLANKRRRSAEITPSGATNITAHTVDQRIWRAAKLRWFSPKPADFQQKGSAGTLCVTVATMALPDAGILSQRARPESPLELLCNLHGSLPVTKF